MLEPAHSHVSCNGFSLFALLGAIFLSTQVRHKGKRIRRKYENNESKHLNRHRVVRYKFCAPEAFLNTLSAFLNTPEAQKRMIDVDDDIVKLQKLHTITRQVL